MPKYDRKDRFYQKAKAEGHASRAFYKIEQIQKKYKILRSGDKVVDLGCAPGGWIQYISKIVGKSGKVIGFDLLPLSNLNLPNVEIDIMDVTDEKLSIIIEEKIGKANVVVSDMAPSTSGVKFRDNYLSYELAMIALDVARNVLKKGGNFVTKIFPGEEFASYKKELQKHFTKVHQYRPEATRKTSIEVYLIGKDHRRPQTTD